MLTDIAGSTASMGDLRTTAQVVREARKVGVLTSWREHSASTRSIAKMAGALVDAGVEDALRIAEVIGAEDDPLPATVLGHIACVLAAAGRAAYAWATEDRVWGGYARIEIALRIGLALARRGDIAGAAAKIEKEEWAEPWLYADVARIRDGIFMALAGTHAASGAYDKAGLNRPAHRSRRLSGTVERAYPVSCAPPQAEAAPMTKRDREEGALRDSFVRLSAEEAALRRQPPTPGRQHRPAMPGLRKSTVSASASRVPSRPSGIGNDPPLWMRFRCCHARLPGRFGGRVRTAPSAYGSVPEGTPHASTETGPPRRLPGRAECAGAHGRRGDRRRAAHAAPAGPTPRLGKLWTGSADRSAVRLRRRRPGRPVDRRRTRTAPGRGHPRARPGRLAPGADAGLSRNRPVRNRARLGMRGALPRNPQARPA